MKFNLKKYAKETVPPYQIALDNQRTNTDLETTTDAQLEDDRLNDDNLSILESRLKRNNETLSATERNIENNKKRSGKDSFDSLPVNSLAEIEDAKKSKAYSKAYNKTEQMFKLDIDESKIISQLHNDPERFKNLSKEDILDNKGYRKMILASLCQIDKKIHDAYAKSSSEEELNKLSNQKGNLLDLLYGI